MRHDENGAIAIVVAFFAVVLFGFAALVVDIGNAADVKAQAAAAADSGALAGSHELASWVSTNGPVPDPNLERVVKDAVGRNMYLAASAWDSCTDTPPAGFTALSSAPCIQYRITTNESTVTSSAVRVRIPVRKVEATFGGLFGVSSIRVSPVAAAQAGQDPPSPCEPCEPRLDVTTGQPVSQATLPDDIRSKLPDPAEVALAPDPNAQGCPTGPGRFVRDVKVTGPACTLGPGLYVFDGTQLAVQGSLLSSPVDGVGVTLIFYGREAIPLNVDGTLSLTATLPGRDTTRGEPIPGIAIVIDQFDQDINTQRSFELGTSFNITGSVYALDGQTKWATDAGDCAAGSCWVHDQTANSVLAVTTTAFDADSGIPTVRSDHPAPLPPPRPPHLVE